MKTLCLIFFVFVVVLLLILYPFKIRLNFHINLLLNLGYISFNVFFIRLLAERFKINNKLEFESEKERSSHHKKLISNYISNLAKKVKIKKIDLFIDIGDKDDACFISLFSGAINSIVLSGCSILLNKSKDAKVYLKTKTYYDKQSLETTGEMIAAFNLIDVFLSLVNAVVNLRKGEI